VILSTSLRVEFTETSTPMIIEFSIVWLVVEYFARESWFRKIEAATKEYHETEKKKREKAHQSKHRLLILNVNRYKLCEFQLPCEISCGQYSQHS
jgi:uncharacterized membrane protein